MLCVIFDAKSLVADRAAAKGCHVFDVFRIQKYTQNEWQQIQKCVDPMNAWCVQKEEWACLTKAPLLYNFRVLKQYVTNSIQCLGHLGHFDCYGRYSSAQRYRPQQTSGHCEKSEAWTVGSTLTIWAVKVSNAAMMAGVMLSRRCRLMEAHANNGKVTLCQYDY